MDIIKIAFFRHVKDLCMAFLRFLNGFITKPQKNIMFLPHGNCRYDNYDVINFSSDNVLALLNYVLHTECYNDYHLYVVYYHSSKLNKYLDYCRNNHLERIRFVHRDDKVEFVKAIIRSKIIFTDNYYEPIRYKAKKQQVVCLGYYAAPFKDDFFKVERTGFTNSLHKSVVYSKAFDFHISNSDLCSRLISLDSLIWYPHFLPLGFPRNDIFYKQEIHGKIETLIKSCIKNVDFDKIVCYAPTYRDYENSDNVLNDSLLIHNKTIFGSKDLREDEKLHTVLEKTNSIIIAKLHPRQEQSVIISNNNRRIIMFSELLKHCTLSLQELLAVSDILITDYSSTFYDYLHLRRPILYYFYDIEVMTSKRGLFIDPITPLCAGKVTYNIKELSIELEKAIVQGDSSAQQREHVFQLINKYKDGNSAKRIAEYFLS